MQLRCCGSKNAGGLTKLDWLAVKITYGSTCRQHQGNNRHHVMRGKTIFHHQINMTRRKQCVIVTITTVIGNGHLIGKPVKINQTFSA